MGILDKVQSAISKPLDAISAVSNMFSDKDKEKTGNSLFNFLFSNKDTQGQAEGIRENSEKERAVVFEEVASSLYRRWFPNLSKFTDLAKVGADVLGIRKRGPEAVPWQHEFETITAFSMLVPDSMLKHLTDPLAKSDLFKKLVEYWPTTIPQSMKDELAKDDYDPDVFFDIIRVMNQDISAGKTTIEGVLGLIPGGSLMGGAILDKIKSLIGK